MTKTNQKISRKNKIDKFGAYDVVIYVILAIIAMLVLIPIWKVLVDSFDLQTAYGMKFFPERFGLAGYRSVFTNPTLYQPLQNSVFVTVFGTLVAMLISTLAAYVLIQWDMPGRNFFAGLLLFTMIFNGGMIPTFLVVRSLNLNNNLWGIILISALNVYNLVLMRNFFEGIPAEMFEAAEMDGASPFKTFLVIVLPLSKAALASIGLLYMVSYWNDYTNFKIYITDSDLYNFQMKLRSIILGSDLPTATGGATANTVQNAAIITAILPFMIIYPMLQKYFVTGLNIGAVKG